MFYDTIARYYDAENEFFTDDLPFYLELAEQYGDPVMDVGCGTGRILFPLAQAGYRTIGVDYSPEMLAIARRKIQALPDLAAHIKLVEANILNFDDQTRYPLILIPYNGLMHFREQADQLQLLQRMVTLLADDGLLVIDLPNAGEAFASENENSVNLERTFILPENGNLVMQQSVSAIDRVEQKLHVTWIYDEITADQMVKRTVAPLVLRYIFASEMQLLFKLAGLETVAVYGDYDQGDFVDGCERLILLARKASSK